MSVSRLLNSRVKDFIDGIRTSDVILTFPSKMPSGLSYLVVDLNVLCMGEA